MEVGKELEVSVAVTRRLPFIIAFGLSGVLVMPLDAQEPRPTFSSSTRLVTVAVTVLRGTAPVVGLTRDDFEVRSNGRIAPIVQFSGDAGPVTAAVLLDVSGSMTVNRALTPAMAGIEDLLRHLDHEGDRVGLYRFAETVTVDRPIAPVTAVRPLVQPPTAYGLTSMYDAVLTAGQALTDAGPGRRGLVVFTDGVDTSSAATPVDVGRHLADLDVPVFVVAIGGAVDAGLSALAQHTGGAALAVRPTTTSMAEARSVVMSSLRQHYLLAFEPDAQPGWHSLSVRTRQHHTVRARTGYTVSSRF